MEIKQAEKIKDKVCEYIEKILEKLENETGMICHQLFVESDINNLKPKVDMHLRLKFNEEVINDEN